MEKKMMKNNDDIWYVCKGGKEDFLGEVKKSKNVFIICDLGGWEPYIKITKKEIRELLDSLPDDVLVNWTEQGEDVILEKID